MKRIAIKNITSQMWIEKGSSNEIYNFAPRVCDLNGNIIGYVTFMDFHKMLKEGTIKKVLGDYWYARYMLVEEAR